ncbi:MAG: Na+/H+ antiporter subunit E [Anaerolineales bacterium]|nr:Na+/H+ antiporter subunit E [Anaerolineales bacterium]
MNAFVWNLILALIWVAATGNFSFINLFIGFLIGFLVLVFTRRIVGSPEYFIKVGQVLGLGLFFIWELILANLRVAHDVITPRHYMRPGVLAIPLDAQTDLEITMLSNLITLTPGTLSLDISVDRRVLYLHAMYIDDPEEVRRKIKDGYERRILEVLR